MKTFLTFGVYDILHVGHIILFKNIKNLIEDGDCRLIVAVQNGERILKYKPNTTIINDTTTRMFMVKSIVYVDEVIEYSDVDIDIKYINFDAFVKGPDQNHDGFKRAENWCKINGKEVIVIPRTESISSTFLRSMIKDSINSTY